MTYACDLCAKTGKGGRRRPQDWVILYYRTRYDTGGTRYKTLVVCDECKVKYSIASLEYISRRDLPSPPKQ
jgi:hypothetical protein